jgi:adenosylmethionine-8-amino-7-oxononanoate aminotransferase
MSSLTQRDQKVIWHPYTQHKNMLPPIAITKGEGALLFDENNNCYIDAISSWCINIHDHAHTYIA